VATWTGLSVNIHIKYLMTYLWISDMDGKCFSCLFWQIQQLVYIQVFQSGVVCSMPVINRAWINSPSRHISDFGSNIIYLTRVIFL
jgi:hypothetical protein